MSCRCGWLKLRLISGMPASLINNNITSTAAGYGARYNGLRMLALQKAGAGSRNAASNSKERRFLSGFDLVPELKSANESVQRIFSLDQGYQRDRVEVEVLYGRKQYEDPLTKSIVTMTIKCSELLRHCQANKKDKVNKVFYIYMLDQRKKKLKRLKEEDPKRYFELIQELSIPELKDPNSAAVKYRFRKFKRNVPLKKKRELHAFEEDRML